MEGLTPRQKLEFLRGLRTMHILTAHFERLLYSVTPESRYMKAELTPAEIAELEMLNAEQGGEEWTH